MMPTRQKIQGVRDFKPRTNPSIVRVIDLNDQLRSHP
jgi:hypothetical protein